MVVPAVTVARPSVPPARVNVLVLLRVVAMFRVPLDRLTASVTSEAVRLFIESVTFCVWVMGADTAMLITASSFGPGKTLPIQLLGVSQSPPAALDQNTMDGRNLSSSASTNKGVLRNRPVLRHATDFDLSGARKEPKNIGYLFSWWRPE
jgi:hypothetical protein